MFLRMPGAKVLKRSERASRKHVKTGARVASSASGHVGRVVSGECSRSVMTRRAIISRPRVLLGKNVRHLTSLRRTRGSYRMTIGAVQTLRTRVIAVAEDRLKYIASHRCPAIGRDLVTDIA